MWEKLCSSPKRPLTIIPFFFTFANALFGFLAVVKTLDDQYIQAAICILFAALMDLCDGRLARLLGSAGYLGMELDSLCDAISFCFAPAILMYSWSLHRLGIAGLMVLGLFLCCGLFRLARFNVLHTSQTHYFIGLPTTIAAFFLANFMLYEDWIAHSVIQTALRPELTAFIVCIIALLMISSIKFPSGKYFKMRLALGGLIFVLVLLSCWALVKGYPIMLFLITAYIVVGFLMGIFKEIIRPLYYSRRNR